MPTMVERKVAPKVSCACLGIWECVPFQGTRGLAAVTMDFEMGSLARVMGEGVNVPARIQRE